MEAFCVNLWTVLSYFIGTEEQVLLRRRYYELRGKFLNFNSIQLRTIYSGSQAEGLALKGSDYDTMFVRYDLAVSMPTDQGNYETNIVMETDHIKPGFVRLRCNENIRNNRDLISSLVQTNDGLVLSSLFFRDNIVDEVQKQLSGVVAHGPCATAVQVVGPESVTVEYDFMHCLPCSTWLAAEWRYRTRNNGWPSRALIKDIIQEGCLLVPIGNPHSINSFIEWRISFSLAEKRLVHSFNHTQLLCYGLLKLYLKHVVNSNTEVKDLLCSYFLKTSLFYCIEEESISWCKENIFDCFWICFRRLLKWVQQGYCPNYFIKENNMMEGKICGSNQRILLRYLSKLYAEGHFSLRRIPCLSGIVLCFQRVLSTGNELRFKEFLFDRKLYITTNNLPSPLTMSVIAVIKTLESLAKMMREARNTSIDETILQTRYNNYINFLIQQLYKETLGSISNKTRYKKLKGLKLYIKLNCMNLDECNRMLLLGTLCYLNGEFKEVVFIVEELLTIYGRFMTMICNRQLYMAEICGQGYTLQQKFDLGMFSYWLEFLCDCKFYPREIESEVSQVQSGGYTMIPAIIYSHVLLVLTYYHLKLTSNMNYALNGLYLAAHDDLLFESVRRTSIALLHKCIEVTEWLPDNM